MDRTKVLEVLEYLVHGRPASPVSIGMSLATAATCSKESTTALTRGSPTRHSAQARHESSANHSQSTGSGSGHVWVVVYSAVGVTTLIVRASGASPE
eukprot:5207601-Prymnesium_polylepis.1